MDPEAPAGAPGTTRVVSSGSRPVQRGRQTAYFLILTTTVLAWTSWKPWRLELLAAV